MCQALAFQVEALGFRVWLQCDISDPRFVQGIASFKRFHAEAHSLETNADSSSEGASHLQTRFKMPHIYRIKPSDAMTYQIATFRFAPTYINTVLRLVRHMRAASCQQASLRLSLRHPVAAA